jgi:uncharacterized protein
MTLTIAEYAIALAGSFLAGGINTLAGNGSVITLTILTDLVGLQGNAANGTNRVGVMFQSAASSYGFFQNNLLPIRRSWFIILITIIGAMAGVYTAINISNEAFKDVFKYLMVAMLVVVLVKPDRWLKKADVTFKTSPFITVPVFLILGFYGGFIQMGMGLFYLAVLVLISKYNMMEANGIKTFVTFVYTAIVLLVFSSKGLVVWEIGLVMAAGQALGGYLTAAYATQYKNINLWAYRLLIFIIITAILFQFVFFTLFK